MADYQIGNIALNFKVQSNNISNSIKRIKNAFESLNDIKIDSLENKFKAITEAMTPFLDKIKESQPALEAMSEALNLKKLELQIATINSKLEVLQSKTATALALDTTKIANANVKLDTANEKLRQAQAKTDNIKLKNEQVAKTIELTDSKIKKVNSSIKNTEKGVDNVDKKAKKTSGTFSKLFNIGKIYFFINYTKRLAQAIGRMATNAIGFNETLNKFQVSMGNNYGEALKFVNDLTYAFNLSRESIMNYQSTFKNMLDAMGTIGDSTTTYKLSETLTRMAIDYASLFNVSVETAMQQFQSVLSGQIRSIRTTSGYDVSEASLFNIYQSLGGQKTMRQLDQTEKRLLRILAIQKQMSNTGAVGDFEKTINQSANILKQMEETWKEISTWIGTILMEYLEPFLEKTLAVMIVVREMLKSLAIARGYEYESFGKGGMFGAIEESAEAAEDAVNSLKTNLLGFDRLNILGSKSTSGSLLPDYKMLTSHLAEYNGKLSDVKNNSNDVAENILSWLGYTKEVKVATDETGNEVETITWVLQEGETNLGTIKSIVEAIAVTVGGIVAFNLGSKVVSLASALGPVGVAVAAIAGTMAVMSKDSTVMQEAFNGIKERFNELASDEDVRAVFNDIKLAIEKAIEMFSLLVEMVSIDFMNSLTAACKFIKGDFAGAFNSLNGGFDGAIEKSLRLDKTMQNSWLANFFLRTLPIEVPNAINKFFTETIPNLWKKFSDWLSTIPSWFREKVFKPIGNFFVGIFEGMINGVIDGINFIIEKISSLTSRVGWDIELIEHVNWTGNSETSTADLTSYTDSLNVLVNTIVESNQQVVHAIEKNGNKPIELNGRKVSEAIYDDLQEVSERKGFSSGSSYGDGGGGYRGGR